MKEQGLKNACFHCQRKLRMYKLNKSILEEGAIFQEYLHFTHHTVGEVLLV